MPAWGERCISAMESVTLAATQQSARHCGAELRFIIHTDQPDRLAKRMPGLEVEFLPVPPGSEPHGKLGNAHRQALRAVRPGECLAFINADMICSIELFGVAERHFRLGKRIIMMTGTRTIGARPPVGARSADLLRWSIQHAHPSTTECFFGIGHSKTTSMIYFRRDTDIDLHAFHLHPFAVMADRPIVFSGVTVDSDLQDNFREREIHIITSADEASFAEMSPPERLFSSWAEADGHQ